MNYSLLCTANALLEISAPVTGDTRNMKTPIIVAVVAVVLIVACLALSGKKDDGKGSKDDK